MSRHQADYWSRRELIAVGPCRWTDRAGQPRGEWRFWRPRVVIHRRRRQSRFDPRRLCPGDEEEHTRTRRTWEAASGRAPSGSPVVSRGRRSRPTL